MVLTQKTNMGIQAILWGNVSINVLLALLSNSIMAGAAAFLFSTFVITLVGEIIPQAYFSRNALKMAALFIPLLKVYRVLLYPVAKPCALILDAWLGRESRSFFPRKGFNGGHPPPHGI